MKSTRQVPYWRGHLYTLRWRDFHVSRFKLSIKIMSGFISSPSGVGTKTLKTVGKFFHCHVVQIITEPPRQKKRRGGSWHRCRPTNNAATRFVPKKNEVHQGIRSSDRIRISTTTMMGTR